MSYDNARINWLANRSANEPYVPQWEDMAHSEYLNADERAAWDSKFAPKWEDMDTAERAAWDRKFAHRWK